MPPSPEIIAHRGGARLWPENSLTAFRACLGLAVDQAECDVHLSADGVPVVIHDATLDRVSDAVGPVAARDSAALAAIQLKGEGGGVPRLADLASLFVGATQRLRIEIKPDAMGRPYPGLVAKSLAVLDAAGIRERSVLIGFQAETMAEARAAGGLHGVSWLIERRLLRDAGLAGVMAVARLWGFEDLGFTAEALDAPSIARLRDAGFSVNIWGADDAPALRRALGLGVHALATDDPVLALRLRG